MNTLRFTGPGWVSLSALLLSLHCGSFVAHGQDRLKPMRIVFPPAAFIEKGGVVIDATKPPYKVKGDGKTDNTEAFVALFEAIQDRNEAKKPTAIVYLPSGTYLVSDTLARRTRLSPAPDFNYRIMGEDRNNTIIKLKDNLPAFAAGADRPVLTCNPSNSNNGGMMWGHQLRNLTIDTGKGNPGAVGITWRGANATIIENVTIRSGDGQGSTGLFFREWCVQGHFNDITIKGFDVGIRTQRPSETNPTIEYVTLKNQRQAGIIVDRSTPCFRRIESINSVPALKIIGEGSHCVIIDSKFVSGAPGVAAIELVDSTTSQLFVRDLKVSGYSTSILMDGKSAATGKVTEWLSGPLFSFDPKAEPKTLRLPIAEVDLVPWESDVNNWASPDDFPGENDHQKIQAALNSGKPALIFPRPFKVENGLAPLKVPATVRQIDFLNLDHKWGSGFEVTEASNTTLWVENPGDRPLFNIMAKRNFNARYGTVKSRVTTDEPVILQFQAICRFAESYHPRFCPPNATIYGRSINEENWHDKITPNFVINGGTMWVLGFKTEAQHTAFHVKNRGRLEVLGGYVNFAGKHALQNPDLINEDSEVTYIGTNYMSRTHWMGIREIRGGMAKDFPLKVFPVRKSGQPNNYFVPLYVGLMDAKFEMSLIRFPAGTKFESSFKTDNGKGADQLFDGDPDTWIAGAGGSYQDVLTATSVIIRFPKPENGIAAVRTGASDKFHNYYPMAMEFWADTTGDGKFDTKVGATTALGPDKKSEGVHKLTKGVNGIHAFEIRVTKQHTGGGGRAWTMNEIALLKAN
mgnify:CR=1 FL=1